MAKKRTVRVLQAVRVDDETQGLAELESRSFWDVVMDKLRERPEGEATHFHAGHHFTGVYQPSSLPTEPLLYMAKERNAEDLPSTWGPSRQGVPLDRQIHEPLFVLPIHGTPAIAVLGTSGAATPSALGRWLTTFLDAARHGFSIELHPVLLGGREQKLAAAIGATRLEVAVEASTYEAQSDSHIERSLESAASASPALKRIGLTMSMGAGRHREGDMELLRGAQRLNGDGSLLTGKTTLMLPTEDGGFRTEFLDLVAHRFTHKVKVGSSDTSLSVDTAEPALREAIGAFMATDEFRRLSVTQG